MMNTLSQAAAPGADLDVRRRRRLALWVVGVVGLALLAGLATGAAGFSPRAFWADLHSADAGLILGQIRAPRSLGAALVGALLGLSGALAQGLFRNPLADPYLLGSAAGAGLGAVAVLAAAALGGGAISLSTVLWIERIGLVGVAAGIGRVAWLALRVGCASRATCR